jgi:hypothetical protein
VGKYDSLRDYLAGRAGDKARMMFRDVERSVRPLPGSPGIHAAWWVHDSLVEVKAWNATGCDAQFVDQDSDHVVSGCDTSALIPRATSSPQSGDELS